MARELAHREAGAVAEALQVGVEQHRVIMSPEPPPDPAMLAQRYTILAQQWLDQREAEVARLKYEMEMSRLNSSYELICMQTDLAKIRDGSNNEDSYQTTSQSRRRSETKSRRRQGQGKGKVKGKGRGKRRQSVAVVPVQQTPVPLTHVAEVLGGYSAEQSVRRQRVARPRSAMARIPGSSPRGSRPRPGSAQVVPQSPASSSDQQAPDTRPQTAPQYQRGVSTSTRRRLKLARQARQATAAFDERPPAVSAQEEGASELLLSLSDDDNAPAKMPAGDLSAIAKEGSGLKLGSGLSMAQVGMLKRRVRGFSVPKHHFPSEVVSEADQQVAAELRWSDSAMTLPEFHRIEVQLRKQAVDLAEENSRLHGQVDVMNATIMRHHNARPGRLTQQARVKSPKKAHKYCWQGLQMHSSLGCKHCLGILQVRA